MHDVINFFPGIKFIVLADPRQAGIDALLRKMYEIYSDFALKNPFYSLEMPIRYLVIFLPVACDLQAFTLLSVSLMHE